MQFLSWRKLKISNCKKSCLSQGAALTAQKTCPGWYPLLQIASKSYRHLKMANYLILVMLTIPIRKQSLSNSCALMALSWLPPQLCLTQEWASSALHLAMNTSTGINAQCPVYLQVILAYKQATGHLIPIVTPAKWEGKHSLGFLNAICPPCQNNHPKAENNPVGVTKSTFLFSNRTGSLPQFDSELQEAAVKSLFFQCLCAKDEKVLKFKTLIQPSPERTCFRTWECRMWGNVYSTPTEMIPPFNAQEGIWLEQPSGFFSA